MKMLHGNLLQTLFDLTEYGMKQKWKQEVIVPWYIKPFPGKGVCKLTVFLIVGGSLL